jgi:hypothetical protein
MDEFPQRIEESYLGWYKKHWTLIGHTFKQLYPVSGYHDLMVWEDGDQSKEPIFYTKGCGYSTWYLDKDRG